MISGRHSIACTFGTVVGLAGLAGASGGEIIYDNTRTSTGSTSFSALQIGDEIEPAGRDRNVLQLEIGLTHAFGAGTADVQARLYANDGSDGEPGTLLWESDVLDDVAFTGGFDLVTFEVPSVEVPELFTWTVQISDTEPMAVGLPQFHPPTVGSSPDHAWSGDGTTWTKIEEVDPVDFMARVRAQRGDCPGGCPDLTGCGTVGFADLLAILNAWGPCPGCLEDLDCSGDVGFADLLTVLAAWGPCSP
jgi:hypothetical protein